jgi:hypothetical protein
MFVSSPDLFAPFVKNIDMSSMKPPPIACDPTRYLPKPTMVWESSLSEFVHYRMVELVTNVDSYSLGF